jgi:hypothetical protein
MDVFSTELGIRLSFVKTSEFRGGVNPAPQTTPLGTPLTLHPDVGAWLQTFPFSQTISYSLNLKVMFFFHSLPLYTNN